MLSHLSPYAKLLTGYCLSLKRGDRVFIRSTPLAAPLLCEVYREITLRGASYDSRLTINDEERIFFESADDELLKNISPLEEHVYERYDAILTVRAPYNLKSLNSIPSALKMNAQSARGKLQELFSSRSAAGTLRWALCEYPTDASAQECGMSLSEYSRFIVEACRLDTPDPEAAWRELSAEQESITAFLNGMKHLRFTAPGTDIEMSVAGRRWINSDGKRNMPSGEVFSAPVEDSVNGFISFSFPVIYSGEDIEGLCLEVRAGEIVSWQADKGMKVLDSLFAVEGARRFGEVAVGLNRGVSRFTRNILFDEKMDGTIHMAVGSTYPETGGINKSPVHLDFITSMKHGGRIFADTVCVYEDGHFIFDRS